MKHIAIHVIQSFPSTCLNRDDTGRPKTAFQGGTLRARLSSQCLKRIVREMCKKNDSFKGVRSRQLKTVMSKSLSQSGKSEEEIDSISEAVYMALCGGDGLIYLSEMEIDTICKFFIDNNIVIEKSEKGKMILPKKAKKDFEKMIKTCQAKDMADICFFGRFMASSPSLIIDSASEFNHALSTHKVEIENDYFSALDDVKELSEDSSGSGHIGVAMFDSATYYRCVILDLDMIFDKNHLHFLDAEGRKKIVSTFIKAVVRAVPSAKKNSMFGATVPEYVMITMGDDQPLSLANAFEREIPSEGKGSISERSVAALKIHHEETVKTYGIEEKVVEIPKVSLSEALIKVQEYVE